MEEFCHAYDNPRIKSYFQMGRMLAENVRTSLSPHLVYARSVMSPIRCILGECLEFQICIYDVVTDVLWWKCKSSNFCAKREWGDLGGLRKLPEGFQASWAYREVHGVVNATLMTDQPMEPIPTIFAAVVKTQN